MHFSTKAASTLLVLTLAGPGRADTPFLPGPDPEPGLASQVLQEAARERARHPELFQARPEAAAAGDTWFSLGPSNCDFILGSNKTIPHKTSGRVKTILPHPADANTVYLVTGYGGVWKTTNFTALAPTWTPLTDAVGSTTGGAGAFGRNPDTLYVGMGDFQQKEAVGGYVLVSNDGGATWATRLPLGAALPRTAVYDVKVDTSTNADIVLVGLTRGLARSPDGGATFAQVTPNGPGGAFGTVNVRSLARTSAGWLAAVETPDTLQGSLWLSTDLGVTWNAIANPGNGFAGAGRVSLGVGAPGDAVVYAFAAAAGDGAQLDLFRSADGGQSWQALGLGALLPANPNTNQPDMNLMGSQAGYDQLLLVDPRDAARNTVYLGGQQTSAKSLDGGRTWTLISDWMGGNNLPYIHSDFHAAALRTLAGTTQIFFGTDGGLTYSVNNGAAWIDSKNRGLVTDAAYAIACGSDPISMLVALQDNSTRIRVDDAGTWNQVITGDGVAAAWPGNGYPLTANQQGGIYRAKALPPQSFLDWTTSTTGILELGSPEDLPFVTPLVAAPSDPTGQTFFTATNARVYRSGDGGRTWAAIGTSDAKDPNPGTGSTMPGFPVMRSVFHGLAVSPEDANHLAVACPKGIILTLDGGATPWRKVNPAETLEQWPGRVSSLAYVDDAHLYIASDRVASAPDRRVALSVDGGDTWAFAGNGLPDVPVDILAMDFGDPTGQTLYAGTWIGLYRSTDGGAHWNLCGAGLPQTQVTDLAVAPDGSYLRVATWGRGVWQLTSAAPSAALTTPLTVNQGDRAVASVPEQPGRTYLWTVTNGTILSGANAAQITFQAGVPGTLTLAVTVTGAAGATANASKAIPVNLAPPPDPTITAPGSAMTGAGGLSASARAQNGCTYLWTVNGGTAEAAVTGPTLAFRAGTGASLTLGLTVTNGAGISVQSTRVVPLFAPIAAWITAPACVLPGAQNLAAQVKPGPAGTTYFWSIDGGTLAGDPTRPSVTFNAGNDVALNLSVQVTRGIAFTAVKRVQISDVPAPVATITKAGANLPTQGDQGFTFQVPAQPGSTYAWTVSSGGTLFGARDGAAVAVNVNPAAAQLVLGVTVTNPLGFLATASAAFQVLPAPDAKILAEVVFLAPNGAGSVRAPNQHPGDQLAWTVTGGALVRQDQNAVFFTAGAGPQVTVGLTVTNAAGRTAASQAAIPVLGGAPRAQPAGIALLEPGPPSQGQAYTALLNGAPAGTAVTWSVAGGTSLAAVGNALFFEAGTGPSCTLTATTGAGTTSLEVALLPDPSAALTVTPAPTPGATVTASVPAQAGARYQWTVNGGQSTGPTDQSSLTVVAGNGANLELQVQVTGPGGLSASADQLFALAPATDDLDGDGAIEPMDMAVFVPALGRGSGDLGYDPAADLNGDGVVDDADIAQFLAAFPPNPG